MPRAAESPVDQQRPQDAPRHDGHDRYVVPFDRVSATDVAIAGGKGANLGELARAGLPVPSGFVVNVAAYEAARDGYGLRPRLHGYLDAIDLSDTHELESACDAIIGLIRLSPLPDDVLGELRAAYDQLVESDPARPVIVRSSATLEDSVRSSFAGMNRTCANVLGFDAVVQAVKTCWASQFAPRSVFYRERAGYPVADATIAVVVQRYVPAAQSGVMFTVDPTTGDAGRLVVEATVGGGEALVSGRVTPDLFVIDKQSQEIVARSVEHKELRVDDVRSGGTTEHVLDEQEGARPAVTDDRVLELARLALRIESHYGRPQDVEWVIDTKGASWIVQSRPITSSSTGEPTAGAEPAAQAGAGTGAIAVSGLGASGGTATGRVRILRSISDSDSLRAGDVLVAHMTAPDWVPLMRRAAAVVTDSGGMTCHAAIVARELGIPCVVGTHTATTELREGELVTVDGAAGTVARGSVLAPSAVTATAPATATSSAPRPTEGGRWILPARPATAVMVNLSEPSRAGRIASLDCDGVGLLRAELMMLEALEGTHPRVLLEEGRSAELVDRLAASIGTFAAAFDPRPVTYRTIDLRSNEFRGLAGGERFEPVESNPMIGYRGAARYVDEPDLFDLELRALMQVRRSGHTNVRLMLPFVRTPRELAACRRRIAAAGLFDDDRFELWIMAEVPSVLPYLEQYADLGVDGVSIGSNDLTQLVLGVDRDSEQLAARYDERDEAVTWFVDSIVRTAHGLGMHTSICGQAPSVHAEYLDLLVRAGIDSISVSADTFEHARGLIARAEQRVLLAAARERGTADLV